AADAPRASSGRQPLFRCRRRPARHRYGMPRLVVPATWREPAHAVRRSDEQGKPHLLTGMTNNLGSETAVRYPPSTTVFVRDRLAGRPWLTRLPFPVHVVERVETYDYVSRSRFVTRYGYHHGYFDGVEREFRGFGMVEQFDTEELGALTTAGEHPRGDNIT